MHSLCSALVIHELVKIGLTAWNVAEYHNCCFPVLDPNNVCVIFVQVMAWKLGVGKPHSWDEINSRTEKNGSI